MDIPVSGARDRADYPGIHAPRELNPQKNSADLFLFFIENHYLMENSKLYKPYFSTGN
ncbi:hypothetical protein FHS11_001276 [Mucilaginibacter gotjawali]|uniref:Uncharacterized protein n=1 Tax=Mucilaginibacter gotjawali TaxID=1550579 RepID=A0A839SDZ0_9SPHI|nr:hypothetical protein [Mucilaginibacter gotjawali]